MTLQTIDALAAAGRDNNGEEMNHEGTEGTKMEFNQCFMGSHEQITCKCFARYHIPEVLRIETLSYETPWAEDDFLNALRRNAAIGFVAIIKDKVVGFMFYKLARGRFDILNIAIHPECRRQGIGRKLVGRLIAKLIESGRNRITALCWERSLQAQQFFRGIGFRYVKTLQNQYETVDAVDDDAYLFEFQINDRVCSTLS